MTSYFQPTFLPLLPVSSTGFVSCCSVCSHPCTRCSNSKEDISKTEKELLCPQSQQGKSEIELPGVLQEDITTDNNKALRSNVVTPCNIFEAVDSSEVSAGASSVEPIPEPPQESTFAEPVKSKRHRKRYRKRSRKNKNFEQSAVPLISEPPIDVISDEQQGASGSHLLYHLKEKGVSSADDEIRPTMSFPFPATVHTGHKQKDPSPIGYPFSTAVDEAKPKTSLPSTKIHGQQQDIGGDYLLRLLKGKCVASMNDEVWLTTSCPSPTTAHDMQKDVGGSYMLRFLQSCESGYTMNEKDRDTTCLPSPTTVHDKRQDVKRISPLRFIKGEDGCSMDDEGTPIKNDSSPTTDRKQQDPRSLGDSLPYTLRGGSSKVNEVQPTASFTSNELHDKQQDAGECSFPRLLKDGSNTNDADKLTTGFPEYLLNRPISRHRKFRSASFSGTNELTSRVNIRPRACSINIGSSARFDLKINSQTEDYTSVDPEHDSTITPQVEHMAEKKPQDCNREIISNERCYSSQIGYNLMSSGSSHEEVPGLKHLHQPRDNHNELFYGNYQVSPPHSIPLVGPGHFLYSQGVPCGEFNYG